MLLTLDSRVDLSTGARFSFDVVRIISHTFDKSVYLAANLVLLNERLR